MNGTFLRDVRLNCKVMKIKKRKLIVIIIAIIILAVTATIYSVVTLANHSRNAAKKYNVNLFTTAYDSLINYLSDEKLLPQFETAELVEESIYIYLNEDELQALLSKLNDIYPYPISISRGHDRLGSELPYEERNNVYIYFSANYNDRTAFDNGFNTVRIEGRIEGFINSSEIGSTYSVAMYFRYQNNEWYLVKAELLKLDLNSQTYQLVSNR